MWLQENFKTYLAEIIFLWVSVGSALKEANSDGVTAKDHDFEGYREDPTSEPQLS